MNPMSAFKYFLATLAAAFMACVAALYVAHRTWTRPAVVSVSSADGGGAAAKTGAAPEVKAVEPLSEAPAAAVDTELERLTRENAELSAQLAEARARLAAKEGSLKETQERLDELRRPMTADVLSSTLRADLRSGEVVVTGGYRLADGRRLYAFARPVVRKVGGADVVSIEGRYLTLTDEAGKAVGLENLATNAANTLQHGEVWMAGEEAAVLGKLVGTPGTDMVAYPTLSVAPGRSGTITVGDVQLKVTPTLTEGGDGMGMELRLEQPQRPGADAP